VFPIAVSAIVLALPTFAFVICYSTKHISSYQIPESLTLVRKSDDEI